MEIGTVRPINIDEEMQGAYLDYAMSVIVARALPDVRDGLKPVHRRILYAMHDMGIAPDKPYKKSARIVGEVLGKYHPHGDVAVYEAMARMAQDFSLRYMLVDGQGNFGSIDGDSPAAMRYTEARLAAIALEALADIDKDTVDFVPNFDDSLTEPLVLPSALPGLLVNGASGIAVGMTTNIPPHNLNEVCRALQFLIDEYDRLDEITVEDLTRFIQGPDFPTGGVVYRYAEKGDSEQADLIRNAYALGRGRLTVQARVHMEEMSRNRSRITVTELPYQVNKTRLIERIADLVRDGRIEGIADLRDESDRQGMRLCIELTRTVDPREVLSQLFKLTPMQTTFSLRMLALVDGEPRLLPLKRALLHYLDHRQEVITRRSRHLLEKARHRAHILEGLLTALDHIDEVIDIIRSSPTPDNARANLRERFAFSEVQAQAILDMPLRRLAGLERQKIADEYQERQQEIAYLQGLLDDPSSIRQVISQDLARLQDRYGDARRTRIVDREKGHHTAGDLVESEDVLLTLWQDGQVTRSATPPEIPPSKFPLVQMWGNTQDSIAFFTTSGQSMLVPVHQLAADQDTHVSTLTDIRHTETLTGAVIVPHDHDGYLTLATRGGRIKRLSISEFREEASRSATPAMNLDEGDLLTWIATTQGHDEILLVTRQGKAIRFAEDDVRPKGMGAGGVLAIKLSDDDAVVGMGIIHSEAYVTILTETGYAKRTAVSEYSCQKRHGSGVQAIRLTQASGHVAVAAVADQARSLAVAASDGHVFTVPLSAVRTLGRTATGQTIRLDTKGPFLSTEQHGPPTWITVLEDSHKDRDNQ